jgi:hypothetical protein
MKWKQDELSPDAVGLKRDYYFFFPFIIFSPPLMDSFQIAKHCIRSIA